MSTERGAGNIRKQAAQATSNPTVQRTNPSNPSSDRSPKQTPSTPPKLVADEQDVASSSERKPAAAAKRDQASESTSPTTPSDEALRPRQVIAVSASKGPAAFFNLARKFLVTDEMCDLSALEGAIVSAVDAAHLLERSKLATIVRVQTSYVAVEPKRRKSQAPSASAVSPLAQEPSFLQEEQATQFLSTARAGRPSGSPGREMRRARIVITVKRTDSYRKWLEENPLQAIIAGDAGDEDDEEVGTEPLEESAARDDVQRR